MNQDPDRGDKSDEGDGGDRGDGGAQRRRRKILVDGLTDGRKGIEGSTRSLRRPKKKRKIEMNQCQN